MEMRTVDFVQSLRNTATLAAQRSARPDDAYGRLAVTCGTLVADLTRLTVSKGQDRAVAGVLPIDPSFADEVETVRADLMSIEHADDTDAVVDIETRLARLQRRLVR